MLFFSGRNQLTPQLISVCAIVRFSCRPLAQTQSTNLVHRIATLTRGSQREKNPPCHPAGCSLFCRSVNLHSTSRRSRSPGSSKGGATTAVASILVLVAVVAAGAAAAAADGTKHSPVREPGTRAWMSCRSRAPRGLGTRLQRHAHHRVRIADVSEKTLSDVFSSRTGRACGAGAG